MLRGELKQSRLKRQLQSLYFQFQSIGWKLQRYDGDGMTHAQLISMRRTAASLHAVAKQLHHIGVAIGTE